MPHRDGKMFRGTHTTCSDLTARVADIANGVPGVRGVSLGYLQNCCGSTSGTQRVKFCDMPGFILLTVRQASSVQELRVFCTNLQETRTKLAGALRDHDIAICFR
ncbi:MAG: hypothetical protein RLZZ26_241 [Candidatus Parcubacteria bacterium]